jgi:hypothetical protein
MTDVKNVKANGDKEASIRSTDQRSHGTALGTGDFQIALLVTCGYYLWLSNAEVAADLAGQKLIDLIVPRHG